MPKLRSRLTSPVLIAVAAFIVWLTAAGGIEATITYTGRVVMVFLALFVAVKIAKTIRVVWRRTVTPGGEYS